MSAKRILAKSIDTNIEYEFIGVDLAKNGVTVALLTVEGEIIGVDRLGYDELIKSAQELSPTTFAMEPCTEMNFLTHILESFGHSCTVISGKNVQAYVESHFSNQKTDLNDAQALAFLAQDKQIRSIQNKSPEQLQFATLTAMREQYVKQYRQSIVSLKGFCQSWGLNISKGISGKVRLAKMVEDYKLLPQVVKNELLNLIKHAELIQKELSEITKTLKALTEKDEQCKAIQKIPGIGPICACRLKATLGDITRFENPKDLPAYYGLVPKSVSTAHNQRKGKITKRGDKTMRALLTQAACCVINMANKGRLKEKALSKWIEKKQREKMPWGKLTCAIAARLLRIIRAVLISGKPYNPKIAGVAKCSLPKGA